MSAPPANETPRAWDSWSVPPGVPHEARDTFGTGKQAWTDYRNQDRYLRRERTDERSTPVRVRQALFPGDRVKVVPTDDGEGWEAWRG